MQFSSSKMDELLIAEVQKHEVIYNRQKYFLVNHSGPEKYGNKDDAWNYIAITLGTDVDTCKKRWKYLRERYVQQRKQGDTPTYEHLSRPYLEKMKFLDQHIQPRKSYRNVSQFLPSPNANVPFGEFHDSSRSNGSTKNGNFTNYQDNMMGFKAEPEPFHNFSPTSSVQSQNPAKSSPSHYQQNKQHQLHQTRSPSSQDPINRNYSTPAQNEYRDHDVYNIPSSSSSLKSPPIPEQLNESNHIPKRQRLEHEGSSNAIHSNNLNITPTITEELSDNEDPVRSHMNNEIQNARPPFSNELFYSLFQQYNPPAQRQPTRSTEQLLGDLVTAELLRMSKERRKIVQKKILEILFFED